MNNFKKPVENEGKTSIFMRSQKHPVFKGGLAFDDFLDIGDKMLCTLFTFTTSGSWWIVDEISRLEIRFAAFRPTKGPSFIAVPNDLHSMNCSLNIRTHNDYVCSIYCFIAAWHLKSSPSLQPPSHLVKISVAWKQTRTRSLQTLWFIN